MQTLYGKGFTKSNLYSFYSFYKTFPQIFQTLSGKSANALTWSHYLVLLQVQDERARKWYEKETSTQIWSVRTLQRNISSQYYYRLLKSQHPTPVEEELKELTEQYQINKLEFIKNPMIAEFLGMSVDGSFTETELEKSIIANLQKFLMELGKGYAFVARQQHIRTEKEDYYIDLVFYNIKLKRYVLFELKTHPLTHADVGQLDMYVRMYDDLVKDDSDNPTIGILLCTETDKVLAKYSVLNGSEQLFAAKYMAYMPTEEELSREIEQQKRFFLEQHGKEE